MVEKLNQCCLARCKMYISLMIVPTEGQTCGEIMMFVRRSTTCLLPVGKMDYRDEGEKKEFVKIPTYGHPGVGMVPNDYPVGDFRDHFK